MHPSGPQSSADVRRTGSLIAVFVLAAAFAFSGPTRATANHGDGNMPYSVNYQIVESQLRVCDQSAATSHQIDQALGIWNSGLGRNIWSQS